MRAIKKILILIVSILLIFPVVFLGMIAFGNKWIFPDILPEQFSTQQFNIAFNGGNSIGPSVILSFAISFIVSIISVTVAFFISRSIAYHPRKKSLLFLAYLPFVLSPVIYAACLKYFFVVGGLDASFTGVCLAQFIIVFPYNLILFMSFWNKRILAFESLSTTLGATPRQIFLKTTFPLAKQIILIAMFQSFLISWFEFGLTNFIGTGQVQTLTVKMYQYIGEANIHLAALSSLLLIIPPLVLLWINKRFVFHDYAA